MSFDVPPPHPELRRLEPLIGSWQAEEETEPSVLGPVVPVTSRESFQWLDGGYFLVSTYETNGAFSEEGNQYFGRLEDDGLVFEGPARFRYELDDEGA